MDNKRFAYNRLQNVEIEISSLCNRHCIYCPRRDVKRDRALFPMDTFKKIMYELKEIDYDGAVAFHQYNEPLLEYDYLCECINAAKEINPKVRLELYTNGDLLTDKKFKTLKKLGINRMVVTCHLEDGEIWNRESARKKVKKVMNKIHIRRKLVEDGNSVFVKQSEIRSFIYKLKEFGYHKIKNYPFTLEIRSIDYSSSGSNRAGTVDCSHNTVEGNNSLCYYCYSLEHGIHISYKGNVFMCCDCCDDVEEVMKYKIGSVYEEKIYDIFAKKYEIFNSYVNNKLEVCNNCYWNQ